jgi:septum formation protein
MMKTTKKAKKLKPLPVFKSEDEERDFWATYDSMDYFDWSQGERLSFPNLKPTARTISTLILASSSPRRQELLRNAGFEFEVDPSSVPENLLPGEAPEALVRRLAREKAREVAARSPAGSLVLGADTAVVVDGAVLGKPTDAEDASRMLRMLSGRSHRVLTGECLVRAPGRLEALEHSSTLVWFRDLSEAEIQGYVSSGEPMDKAGAYAIQGRAARFVTRIEGCYSNVVGLPVSLVDEVLRRVSGAA